MSYDTSIQHCDITAFVKKFTKSVVVEEQLLATQIAILTYQVAQNLIDACAFVFAEKSAESDV